MNNSFELFPESASGVSDRVDTLYLFLVAVAVFFTVLICALILFFGIRYRRGSKAARANPPKSNLLELAWAVVPLILAMVMFVWGAWIYSDMRTPPDNAVQINVVGKQWMWKVEHQAGVAEINTLHVPARQPVKLRMISEDVIHSFYIPAFRVKQDVLPGYYTTLWFTPTKPGEYHLFCAEYCGTEHAQMRGRIVVMEPDDYADWIAGEAGESPAVTGKRLFERLRCASCHKSSGGGSGPSLKNIWGKKRPLKNGSTVTADAQYLRDSIRDPGRQIVAGYSNLMPAYGTDDLNESKVLKLIAYLKSQQQTPTD